MAKPVAVPGLTPAEIAQIAATGKKKAGLQTSVAPVDSTAVYAGTDQGVDYNQQGSYVAVGNGTILGVGTGWHGGSGTGLYYRLDTPITVNGRTYRDLYIAETTPLQDFKVGDRVVAGQPLMSGGAAELGFANGTSPAGRLKAAPGASSPYNAQGGKSVPTQAGSDFLTYAKGGHTPLTPAQKVAAQTADNNAKLSSPGYISSTTSLSATLAENRKATEQTLHIQDPWVTVVRDAHGVVTGFGTSTGVNPPKDALTIGGQPATKSETFGTLGAWHSTYDTVFQSFTGRSPTPAEQAQILSSGISVYALQQQLSAKPGFTASPIYKQQGAGIADQAKQLLGSAPPKALVTQAIAENWDAATLQAKIQALPAYQKGPVFQAKLSSNTDQFKSIMGNPDPNANAWLKTATVNGWDTTAVAGKLRSDPAYKYSPEYEAKAVNFLDAMGLFTGSRPVLNQVKAPSTGDLHAPLPLTPNLPGASPVPGVV